MKSNVQHRKHTDVKQTQNFSSYTCNCDLQDTDEKLHRYCGLAMQRLW